MGFSYGFARSLGGSQPRIGLKDQWVLPTKEFTACFGQAGASIDPPRELDRDVVCELLSRRHR